MTKYVSISSQMLVPKGCCRSILYSDEYQASWKCNFLGLSCDSALPNHILSSDETFVLLVELKLKDENDLPEKDNDFQKFEFNMASRTRLLEKGMYSTTSKIQ